MSRLKEWTTRGILLTAVLGIVLGLLSTVVDYAYTTAGAALGPLLAQTLIGITMFTALFIPFVVRRPLAAIVGMLIIGLVQLPFSPNGILSLVITVIYGPFVEIAFAVTRYRRYGLPMLMITACVVASIGLVIGYVPNGVHQTAVSLQLLLWGFVLGSSLLGAWLVTVLANSLTQSGIMTTVLPSSDS